MRQQQQQGMVKTFKLRDACSSSGSVHSVATVSFDRGDEDISSADLRFAIAPKDGREAHPALFEVALTSVDGKYLERFSTDRVEKRKSSVNVVAEIQGVKLYAIRWDSDKKALICMRTPYPRPQVQQPPPAAALRGKQPGRRLRHQSAQRWRRGEACTRAFEGPAFAALRIELG